MITLDLDELKALTSKLEEAIAAKGYEYEKVYEVGRCSRDYRMNICPVCGDTFYGYGCMCDDDS